MKIHLGFRIIFCASYLLCQSCIKSTVADIELPSDSLINSHIKRILEIDSIVSKMDAAISYQFCPYTLDYSIDKIIQDSLILPPDIDTTKVNPISSKELLSFIGVKMDSSFNISDTIYISQQITNSKIKFIDTTLINDVKFVKIDLSSQKDYFRLDSIIVFCIPIYTVNKDFVYINYHYKGNGRGMILKRIKDNWIVYREFDTWNRYR